jgi:GTP-binding protein EngB required for normal cell division
MSLRNYEQDKFAIADILRSLSNLAPRDATPLREHLRGLFARLAEDRFNLVVVGRFNRGKTSIMNAIMGTNQLPVGIIPLTSVITTVTYGTAEQVVLRFHGTSLTSEISINALRQYVTQEGNPGNVKRLKVAEVRLRAEILRRGFYFVDTPGLGSAIVENTRTTNAFLPEADAFLLITSYDSPLTEEEIDFLQTVRSSARRIFVVLNKHDTVLAEERQTVLGYVRGQLHSIFGEQAPQPFSVSANDGLTAKQNQDFSRLKASGIPALEESLIRFLLDEKRDQFLQQMCRRTAELVRMASPSSEAGELSTRILALAQRLCAPDHIFPTDDVVPTREQSQPPSLEQLQPCEICDHANEVLWDFECKFQYEISTNQLAQRRFATFGGLCSFHTWQYHAIASPYGICTAYPSLLDQLVRWLRAAERPHENGSPQRLCPPLATPGHCALCTIRAKAESEAVSRLAQRLSKQGVQGLNTLSAICIPHLTMLSGALHDGVLVRQLMNHQAALLERISEDMRRFTLKHDATRRHLETREEAAAALRALMVVAGHHNVVGNAGPDA